MTDTTHLIEHPDHWTLPLIGRTVSRCVVDYYFAIEFLEGPRYEIRIEDAFSVTLGDVATRLLPSEPEKLGPALTLLHRDVLAAVAHNSGELEVTFSGGFLLTVPVSPDYEAWQVIGHDGLLVISLPGGSLAVWTPVADTTP